MNLVWCDKPCRYQQEGVCTLERPVAPTASAAQDCCYFREKKTESGDVSPQGGSGPRTRRRSPA